MATEDLVTEQFQFLGIEISKEVLAKCVNLCEEYDVDAETFIEQWMAYSLNNLNGAAPNLDNLEALARKEFSNKVSNRLNVPSKSVALRAPAGTTVLPTPVISQPENDLLSNYVDPASKASIDYIRRVNSDTDSSTTNGVDTPNSPTSAKYQSRSNSGAVVASFGDEKLLEQINKPNGPDILDLNICQVPNDDGELYTKSLFGFELLHEKASLYDNHIQYLSQCIMKKAGITETTSVRHKTQNEVFVAGGIECDADARLNPKSVVLQGTWDTSLSQAVPLDLDNVQEYSVFPGQVVVARGYNPRGDRFVARQLYTDAAHAQPRHDADLNNTLRGTISILVASGPYTTSDNLAYEPLKDLIAYINSNRPHVVIMTGPFMDSDHATIKSNSLKETFKSVFEKLVDSLGEISATSPFTKIYIVSSHKDAFHVNIYPTPSYSSRRKHANIYFLPDPSTLNIAGFILGVTSTDVMMHLSQEEISHGCSGDRLSRLAGQLLAQQSFSPAAGAGAGAGAAGARPPLDSALWAAHAQLPATPHVLLLPGNFRYSIKDVNGCVVVNPEHLAKGSGGGTFARILISNDGENNKRIAAQIVRI